MSLFGSTQRRRAFAERYGISENKLVALDAAEVPDCGCQLSMTPVCLIRAEMGCSDWRAGGSCGCKCRFLPVCLLDHAGGCLPRREGKRCYCALARLPKCVSPGCDKRQRGRICECPRWPGEPCEHVTSFAARMRFLSAALRLESESPRDAAPDSGWCYLLYLLFPRRYQGREEPGAPDNLIDRRTRVAMMELRRAAGLELWHPDDVRYPAGEGPSRIERRRLRRNAQAFAGLLASSTPSATTTKRHTHAASA